MPRQSQSLAKPDTSSSLAKGFLSWLRDVGILVALRIKVYAFRRGLFRSFPALESRKHGRVTTNPTIGDSTCLTVSVPATLVDAGSPNATTCQRLLDPTLPQQCASRMNPDVSPGTRVTGQSDNSFPVSRWAASSMPYGLVVYGEHAPPPQASEQHERSSDGISDLLTMNAMLTSVAVTTVIYFLRRLILEKMRRRAQLSAEGREDREKSMYRSKRKARRAKRVARERVKRETASPLPSSSSPSPGCSEGIAFWMETTTTASPVPLFRPALPRTSSSTVPQSSGSRAASSSALCMMAALSVQEDLVNLELASEILEALSNPEMWELVFGAHACTPTILSTVVSPRVGCTAGEDTVFWSNHRNISLVATDTYWSDELDTTDASLCPCVGGQAVLEWLYNREEERARARAMSIGVIFS